MIGLIASLFSSSKNELKHANDRLQSANTLLVSIEFNDVGEVISANNTACNLLGYSLTEITGKKHDQLFASKMNECEKNKKIWEKVKSGTSITTDIPFLKNDKNVIWLRSTYTPLLDSQDDIRSVIQHALDITQLKQDEFTRNAYLASQSNSILLDKHYVVTHFNTNFIQFMHSYSSVLNKANNQQDFSINSKLSGLINSHPVLQSLMNQNEAAFNVDYVQDEYVFEIQVNNIFDNTKNFIGAQLEWKDVTEKRAVNKQKIQQEDKSNFVFSALDFASSNIIFTDNDGKLLCVNKSMQKVLGTFYGVETLSGMNDKGVETLDLISLFDKKGEVSSVIENLTTPHVITDKVQDHFFELKLTPVFSDGEKSGIVVEWKDITDEKTIEDEVAKVVEAANNGDFTNQIPVDNKTGYVLSLAQGLNNLTSTVEVALNDISRVLGALSRGVLTERITRSYEGGFGQLKNNTNQSIDKITEIIHKIVEASDTIACSANEISQGNVDLSSRTERQASSLEQTAASMEQMMSTVKQSTDNAEKANELSSKAQLKATEGGEVVTKAVAAMEDINQSSKKINDIISVIDEIAFQTNLLALNAAVEAARAGEQGRGFAVVAGEVRNLAQRSAGAAKEIKELIRDSVEKIEGGTQLVNQSGETLADLVASVESVSEMMNEISHASKEQSTGIGQVNQAVSHMDQMTQQNAALVEQASAAGEAMAEQAASLIEDVSFFSIGSKRVNKTVTPVGKPKDMARPNPVISQKQRAHIKPESTQSKVVTPIKTPDTTPEASFESDDEWEDF